MIVVILPEPVDWWPALRAQLPRGEGAAVMVIAPWAGARGPALPGSLGAFRRRRALPDARAVPLWQLGELAVRAWMGARTDRRLRGMFGVRRLVDALVAPWIARLRPSAVVAPSCGAQRLLAAAHRAGARAVLIEDLPDLRALHDDLDRAARAHPGCRFLRRYRADARMIARQAAERVLADELWVRGDHAWRQRRAAGIDEARLRALRLPCTSTLRRGGRQVLLAGTAAARHGSAEALALVERDPAVQLLVRPGEGTEPAGLLSHPRVRVFAGEPVGVLIAPAWCEAYPAEVPAAIAAGIPVIATGRAAGFADVRRVPVGDAHALAAALPWD